MLFSLGFPRDSGFNYTSLCKGAILLTLALIPRAESIEAEMSLLPFFKVQLELSFET